MAKSAKTQKVKSTTKNAAQKSTKKASSKKATKKASKKTSGAKSRKSALRPSYSEQLKKKVVAAVKKGMTHLEASKAFEVGVHSIPNWLRKHA